MGIDSIVIGNSIKGTRYKRIIEVVVLKRLVFYFSKIYRFRIGSG